MKTVAYYVWKIEVGFKNVFNYIFRREPIRCKYCNKWKNGKCVLFPSAREWNNCVYFERRKKVKKNE